MSTFRKALFFYLFLGLSTIGYSQYNPIQEREIRETISSTSGQERFNAIMLYMDAVGFRSDVNADSLLNEIRQFAIESNDSIHFLWLQLYIAKYGYWNADYQAAVEACQTIIQSNVTTDVLRFKATFLLREVFVKLEAWDKAIDVHRKIDWEYSDRFWEAADPDIFIAATFFKLGDYQLAIQYQRKCIQKMHEMGYKYWNMSYINSLGVMYEKIDELDSAWMCYQQADSILTNHLVSGEDLDSIGYSQITGLFAGNKAQILAKKGEHLKAIPLYKRDIESSLLNPDNMEYIHNGVVSLIKISRSYIATNNLNLARQTIEHAERLLKKNHFPNLERDLLEIWVSYFQAEGDLEHAYAYLQQFIELNDSLENDRSIQQSKNLLIAYESDLKEEELSKQQRKVAQLEIESAEQQTRINYFVILLLLTLIIAVIAFFFFRQRFKNLENLKVKSDEIEAQKEIISENLREKEALLKEVHHRVKNNLQIISSLLFFQSKNVEDPIAKQVMKEGQSRVQTMSLIHQKLYQSESFEKIDYQKYLNDLIQQIVATYTIGSQEIALTIDTTDIKIPVEKAVPLSLIVHELVTNSIKHAFQGNVGGSIHVTIRLQDDQLELEYHDSGSGFLWTEGNASTSGIGIKLIQLLARQLNGELIFDNQRNSHFRMKFPQ